MKYVISALVQSDGVHLRRLQWSEVAVKKCSLSDDASRAHCMAAPVPNARPSASDGKRCMVFLPPWLRKRLLLMVWWSGER